MVKNCDNKLSNCNSNLDDKTDAYKRCNTKLSNKKNDYNELKDECETTKRDNKSANSRYEKIKRTKEKCDSDLSTKTIEVKTLDDELTKCNSDTNGFITEKDNAILERDNLRTAERLATFNKEVSETQSLIIDYNQGYVNNGDNLVAMLNKHIPVSDADATYAKIQYRDVEYANLKNMNNMINILYYDPEIIKFLIDVKNEKYF
jgi:chromosome segregation ATPase